jgi:hypothetical protein
VLDAAGQDLGRFDLAGIHSAANLNALSWRQESRLPEYLHQSSVIP